MNLGITSIPQYFVGTQSLGTLMYTQRLPFNPPSRTSSKQLLALKESIKDEGGIIVPLLIGSDSKIGEGHRRTQAIWEIEYEYFEENLKASFPDDPEGLHKAIVEEIKDIEVPILTFPDYKALKLYHISNSARTKKSHNADQALEAFVISRFRWATVDEDLQNKLKTTIMRLTAVSDEKGNMPEKLFASDYVNAHHLTPEVKDALKLLVEWGKGIRLVTDMYRVQKSLSKSATYHPDKVPLIKFIMLTNSKKIQTRLREIELEFFYTEKGVPGRQLYEGKTITKYNQAVTAALK